MAEIRNHATHLVQECPVVSGEWFACEKVSNTCSVGPSYLIGIRVYHDGKRGPQCCKLGHRDNSRACYYNVSACGLAQSAVQREERRGNGTSFAITAKESSIYAGAIIAHVILRRNLSESAIF